MTEQELQIITERKKLDIARGDKIKFALFKERLSSVVEKEYVEDWLQTSNKAFNNRKPIDLVNEGNFDPLFEMLYRLESGIPG